MKNVITALLFITSLFSVNANSEAQKKILIVASNKVDMGDADKHEARNDLFEFAPPYHVFVSHGYDVDFLA